MTKQKTSKQEELSIKVTSNIPAVVADGHGLAVNNDNGSTNLMFIHEFNLLFQTMKFLEFY